MSEVIPQSLASPPPHEVIRMVTKPPRPPRPPDHVQYRPALKGVKKNTLSPKPNKTQCVFNKVQHCHSPTKLLKHVGSAQIMGWTTHLFTNLTPPTSETLCCFVQPRGTCV